MEQNAPIKLFVLTLTILSAINLTSCRTNKNTTASIEHNGSSETSYSNMELINSKLAALDSLGCGKTNSTLNSLSHMLVYNGDVFDCLKREQKDSVLLRKVLYEITLLVDFEASVSYINFLPAIRNYNDSEFFSLSIELLKHDWHPQRVESACAVYAPVYQYINDQLIMPHIKYIDGKPWVEYFRENKTRLLTYHEDIDHMNYYRQMKDLWESGRITLTSQE